MAEVVMLYPPGCKAVLENMRVEKLTRRLKLLADKFQDMNQQSEDTEYEHYVPLCLHLAEDGFLNHASKDVQLLIACCLADVLRIYAPNAPYRDPEQLKTILNFFLRQLRGLKNPNDAAFTRYFFLLESFATVKTFNVCLDLEDGEEMICSVFGMIFHVVQDDHSPKIKAFMLEILTELLNGWGRIIPEATIKIILGNVVEPVKSANVGAYKLAREFIIKSSELLQFGIENFFNKILIYEPEETGSFLSRQRRRTFNKVFDAMYELNNVCPSIIASVIPQLKYKLKSSDEGERMSAVTLLGKMFSAKDSLLASRHTQLWKSFLRRFGDICPSIRIKCVQYSMHFLLSHPDLRQDIIEALKLRQNDSEENVRFEVVKAIVATSRLNFEVVSESEDLLNCVKDRTFDPKFNVRKEAIQGLGLIYRNHLTAEIVPEATRQARIKDKILHVYYLNSLDDKIVVERIFTTSLVPYNLDSQDRMMKLLYLYVTLDTNASTAFVEIQKTLLLVRRCVIDFLNCIRSHKDSEGYEKYLNVRVNQLAKLLPNPVKTHEFLTKFAKHLVENENSFKTMELIVSPESDCRSCVRNINIILKKLGAPIMTNLYHTSIKLVLERASSVLIDKEAIMKLLLILFDVIKGKEEVLNDIGCDKQQGISRGLRLVSVLAFVFPAHFHNDESLKLLIRMLTFVDYSLQPHILTALTSIGKYKAIGSSHENLMKILVQRCKDGLLTGTPKQAKHALRCMYVNSTQETRIETFSGILDRLKINLDPGNPYCKTSVVALGHIALLMPEEFKSDMKTVISQKIVKGLLINPSRTAKDMQKSDRDWCDVEDLPEITQCMIAGLKATVRWLLGRKMDFRAAANTFKMLTAFIETGGDFINTNQPFSNAEKSWLRLAAGCYMLKVCEQKGVGDQFTCSQFFSLSRLINDEVSQVRSRFAYKLHLGLARGIPHKCLPLDFMGFYALVGYESDKKEKSVLKGYIASDVNKRRDYLKTFSCTAEDMQRIMPDYMLAFGVAVLTQNPRFTSHEDSQQLAEVTECVWVMMEPLIMKSDLYSFGFYRSLLERIKNHKNAVDPENEEINHRMYAVCDIGLSLLVRRSTSFEMKDLGVEPRIPPMYFKKYNDPYYSNLKSYLSDNLVCTPDKKSPVVVSERPKRKRKASPQPFVKACNSNADCSVIVLDDCESIQSERNTQDKVLFAYRRREGDESGSTVEVTVSDIKLLSPYEWLNDTLVDFWCKYFFMEKLDAKNRERSHIFSSFFFQGIRRAISAEKKGHSNDQSFQERIGAWTKDVGVFEKDFLFLPLTYQSHWVLVVICFPGLVPKNQAREKRQVAKKSQTKRRRRRVRFIDSSEESATSESEADDEKKRPCILLLDSMVDENERSFIFPMMLTFLQREWDARNKTDVSFDLTSMPGYFLTVPQQNNYSDCGIFVLKFLECFFLKPLTSFKEPLESKKNWFSCRDAMAYRVSMFRDIWLYMKEHCPENMDLVPKIYSPNSK